MLNIQDWVKPCLKQFDYLKFISLLKRAEAPSDRLSLNILDDSWMEKITALELDSIPSDAFMGLTHINVIKNIWSNNMFH